MTASTIAQTTMQRLDELAQISEEPDCLTRRFATSAMQRANAVVAEWMRDAGMKVRQDNIGNLRGHYPAITDHARTLILGSHLDTVRDAGKYDGPLGVLVALACVEQLHGATKHLPFAIELIAFADEEGLRYHTAYLGSQVVAGSFDRSLLTLTDADGISIADAIRTFGGNPSLLDGDRLAKDELLGYCEVHVEQGPVLEASNLPVGVVTVIAGQSRFQVGFVGQAGHAGTVPMLLRRDALCAAADFIHAVETLAREQPGLVATVGQIEVRPGASNVIPGHVSLSLDVRHQEDPQRKQAIHDLHECARRIADERRLGLAWQVIQESASVACSPVLTEMLAQAVAQRGLEPLHLVSGAGHDAVVLAAVTNVVMLFVRCKGGISHNPAESVTTEDVGAAIDVLGGFLDLLAAQYGTVE